MTVADHGGLLFWPQLPNPNLVRFLPPTSLERKVAEARCLGSDLGEQDLAVLLPFREAEVLGSGGLSRPQGFLRAEDGVRLGWGWWREGQGRVCSGA